MRFGSDFRLADLSELATFRHHLKNVATLTGVPFERLKARVQMKLSTSWRIVQGFREIRPTTEAPTR